MSEKSIFYIVTGVVLISLFCVLGVVSVEFIKSTIEPAPQQQMPFFMMPGMGPEVQPEQQSIKPRTWVADNADY